MARIPQVSSLRIAAQLLEEAAAGGPAAGDRARRALLHAEVGRAYLALLAAEDEDTRVERVTASTAALERAAHDRVIEMLTDLGERIRLAHEKHTRAPSGKGSGTWTCSGCTAPLQDPGSWTRHLLSVQAQAIKEWLSAPWAGVGAELPPAADLAVKAASGVQGEVVARGVQ